MKELQIHITGDVQGVSFRWHAQKQAEHLGLAGWAENQPDGSLQILVQGEEEQIKKFLDWCQKGPPLASPIEIQTKWQKPQKGLTSFEIRR